MLSVLPFLTLKPVEYPDLAGMVSADSTFSTLIRA